MRDGAQLLQPQRRRVVLLQRKYVHLFAPLSSVPSDDPSPSPEFCRAGFYCTNAGCCPNGATLAECGASVSLSVIPPPVATPSQPPTEPSPPPEPPVPTTTAETPAETSAEAPVETPSGVPSQAAPSEPPAPTYPVPPVGPPSNGTATTDEPPVVTAGAGRADIGAMAILGGLGVALMA